MTNTTTLELEARMDRFGLKVAAKLDDQPLAHDISERLRIARQQALAQRKKELVSQTQSATSINASGGAAVLGGAGNPWASEGNNWFTRLAGALPLIALAIGLVALNHVLDSERATELAEVDVQILADELPPDAHTDAGFSQFLKFGPPSAKGAE